MSRGALWRLFYRASLGDHAYKFLFEPGPPDEAVALDCETTGLDPRKDDILAIAAVRIRGNRILTSERFEAIVKPEETEASADSIKVHRILKRDVADALPMRRVLPDLLRFIGGRPLVGYYIAFDVRMLDKYAMDLIEVKLPNPQIEVSSLYYDRKYGNAPPGTAFDLRFDSLLKDLGIPPLAAHDALNDAVMAAMAWLALRDLQARGVRIPRERAGQGPPPPTGG
ncbi:3'-5' exonuclease [Paracraurococcus ruber]|uniref:DNA polymerase III subunit epsilon n=1 Tax=Paracraurococcus ruber TaxID=77675 RepID=A0ABS1CRY7_9PROT|nr:3'-5' exonuclease [Paracraurococcus ruber]MBK1657052.1 DNA polymerase III subunit epsilon [Paracraurococcus ruber]TDG31471.1 3'-5' exonuclease [Paracraurococcus ruber]